MKKTVLKMISVMAMGLSLSACTFLNDMGITKGDITKMASYKKEVSMSEFVHELANSDFSKNVNKDDFHVKDFVADFGFDLEANEVINNSSYKNKQRSKMDAKGSVSLSASYDADNESIKATLKDDISYELENAFLGEASAKHKGEWNYDFQPHAGGYALANTDDFTYYQINTGSGFSLNQSLTQVLKMGAEYLNEVDHTVAQQASSLEEYIHAYNLKFYVDNNVFTMTGHFNQQQALSSSSYVYNPSTGNYEYNTETYGEMMMNFDAVLQIKVTKVTQIRAELTGGLTARFYKDHNSISGGLFQFLDLATTTCVAGDEEKINFEVAAGINLEQKSVTNKVLDLSSYKLLNN